MRCVHRILLKVMKEEDSISVHHIGMPMMLYQITPFLHLHECSILLNCKTYTASEYGPYLSFPHNNAAQHLYAPKRRLFAGVEKKVQISKIFRRPGPNTAVADENATEEDATEYDNDSFNHAECEVTNHDIYNFHNNSDCDATVDNIDVTTKANDEVAEIESVFEMRPLIATSNLR
ncbi:unnamed protein product [Protopolystoma xenopodis]|uniref:Uncharacterized protein n=1 Tax=Protopolystoma xenopodis TaxID=117903 RepID=A0A448WQ44_9PLAT|nr:unnamed protein product [Protopolystoma xenopodis]